MITGLFEFKEYYTHFDPGVVLGVANVHVDTVVL